MAADGKATLKDTLRRWCCHHSVMTQFEDTMLEWTNMGLSTKTLDLQPQKRI